MTNQDLEFKLKSLIQTERKVTNEILKLITLAEDRHLHLERGFSSMFDWLTNGLGYSGSVAFRRIESARLLRVVPGAAPKLESGELSLTNLTKARSSIRAQEKITGTKMAADDQARIVGAVENKTTAQAERALLELLPATASELNREHLKRIDATQSRLSLNLTDQDLDNLDWVKNLYSHALPNATSGELLGRVLAAFRKSIRREVRSCEYRDEVSGRICGCRFRPEEDHVLAKALGGTDDPSNLRWLCRSHNRYMAEQTLGAGWAHAWRRKKVD